MSNQHGKRGVKHRAQADQDVRFQACSLVFQLALDSHQAPASNRCENPRNEELEKLVKPPMTGKLPHLFSVADTRARIKPRQEKWWSHQESNLERPFRKGLLYPFNYGSTDNGSKNFGPSEPENRSDARDRPVDLTLPTRGGKTRARTRQHYRGIQRQSALAHLKMQVRPGRSAR